MNTDSALVNGAGACARGLAFIAAGQVPAGIAELQCAIEFNPGDLAARYALGSAWAEIGEWENALALLSPLAAMEGVFKADAVAKLAEMKNMQIAGRAPPAYIRHLFDQISDDYDAIMRGALQYCADAILFELAKLLLAPKRKTFEILDLGCGTGLAGIRFQHLARRLDGIDLSPCMIEKARARGIYDSLEIGDLEPVLSTKTQTYDLILAADTLVYLGDLGPVFASAKPRLKAGGLFLFTVEQKSGNGYMLGPKRRYLHSDAYVREAAGQAGLEIAAAMKCTPRHERDRPVEGLAFALQRA